MAALSPEKDGEEVVAFVGSGNWGTAVARIVGPNLERLPAFKPTAQMYVYEEEIDGRKLTDIINTDHENVKYLPGFKIPHNIVANPSLADTVAGATLIIFVLPHQFLPRMLPVIKKSMAPNARAISLIKGIDCDEDGLVLVSSTIQCALKCDVAVMMGANVASEVARGEFAEATVGCHVPENAALWQSLFDCDTFRVTAIEDPIGVELSGALKNIVALGAGFCDGLGYGGNTKAAIIRIGLAEIMKFCDKFYRGIQHETFFESCGFADLITTCYGGRNRKCAAAFAKDPTRSWDDIEAELLGGQKLQGTIALREAVAVLKKHNVLNEFPLFDMTYKIAFEGVSPDHIWKLPRSAPPQKVTKRLARPCAASAGLILPEMTTTPVSTYSGAGGAGAGAATQ